MAVVEDITAQQVAAQVGGSPQEWEEAREIMGPLWPATWETVAHLAVHGDMKPKRVAEILMGRSGFPGLIDVMGH